MMINCSHWYPDGTFKMIPPLFAQVWTIHGFKYNNVLSTVISNVWVGIVDDNLVDAYVLPPRLTGAH
jgi:hypothetical protein